MRKGLRIGDEVYIHGYVDEIRRETVIIRNNGGYFGTVDSEITPAHLLGVAPPVKPIINMPEALKPIINAPRKRKEK